MEELINDANKEFNRCMHCQFIPNFPNDSVTLLTPDLIFPYLRSDILTKLHFDMMKKLNKNRLFNWETEYKNEVNNKIIIYRSPIFIYRNDHDKFIIRTSMKIIDEYLLKILNSAKKPNKFDISLCDYDCRIDAFNNNDLFIACDNSQDEVYQGLKKIGNEWRIYAECEFTYQNYNRIIEFFDSIYIIEDKLIMILQRVKRKKYISFDFCDCEFIFVK